MDVTWVNFVHDCFAHESSKASQRQKHVLLDISAIEESIEVSEIQNLTARLAKAYAGLHPRTCMRDIEALEKRGLILRDGKRVKANKDLIIQFLPVRAHTSIERP